MLNSFTQSILINNKKCNIALYGNGFYADSKNHPMVMCSFHSFGNIKSVLHSLASHQIITTNGNTYQAVS